jgi:methylthioribose-1-phosphate isomerase
MGVLEAVRYTNVGGPKLEILDQLQLPHKSHYDPILTAEDGWQAIRQMRTRGAPAIAIVAALSLAVELASPKVNLDNSAAWAKEFIHSMLKFLVTSRPTAVNLEDASKKLGLIVDQAAGLAGADAKSVANAYIRAAEEMLRKDVEDNQAIGRYGAHWIAKHTGHSTPRKVNVITHCNTG